MAELVDEFDLPLPDRLRPDLTESLGLSAASMGRALRASEGTGQPLAVALSLLGLATEDAIADACARLYDAPRWPDGQPLDRVELADVNARFLQDRYAVPLAEPSGSWVLGLVDPGDDATREALSFAFGRDVPTATLTLSAWRTAQRGIELQEPDMGPAHSPSSWLDDAQRLQDIARDAPVIRICDQILERAFLVNASDVHIEQKVDHTRVRYRIDGRLQDQERLSPQLGPGLIARVKVLSDLDVAERRAPQDGRTTVAIRGAPVDVRVSTAPTVFGESLVVRLLTRRDIDYSLEGLGLHPDVTVQLDRLLERPHGLLLVTGPTGSGKTTTLYSALRRLASDRSKILTVEDPVEYVFEDILQCQVNEPAGFTFANALRSFLRHDPDVILVGEIRDAETARLAVQASLTGHLVLATVHTNDAVTTPSRLIDMGVERYLLADALVGVLAQRLVPRLCEQCGTTEPLSSEERYALSEVGIAQPPAVGRAKGCPACSQTGRRGRRPVCELMVCTAEVRDQIGAGASASALRAIVAGRDWRSLRTDAVESSAEGRIDFSDAWRVADQ